MRTSPHPATSWVRSAFAMAFSVLCLAAAPPDLVRTESFDREPRWDGQNNRAGRAVARAVRQDFGYSHTGHAGSGAGEIGGFVTPAAEPAYYARKIPTSTFNDTLTASGTLTCPGRKVHVLLGFFNSQSINEWRTPNSIVIRLQGRGDIFYAYVEYATRKWRAGGDSPGGFATVRDPASGRMQLKGFAGGNSVYPWSLRYDPSGSNGAGAIHVTIGDQSATCSLDAGHKADGAEFNRFGLLNVVKSIDDGGEVYLDNVTVNGEKDDFSRDPGWEGFHNRRSYETKEARPYGDFGYSATRNAGGQRGEMGGLVFRGDCRSAGTMACYGDRLSPLSLDKPLKASGRVALLRGVSDSTTLIGFYHSRDSMTPNPSQSSGFPKSFLGAAVEGPSREGFLFYPAYRENGDAQGYAGGDDRPHILPDGAKHLWTLAYTPEAGNGNGRITVTLDGHAVSLDLANGIKRSETSFDRFGIVTTWIDGNGQRVYFDDLTYTFRQP